MTLDEYGLGWERFASGYGPQGADFVEYRCSTHPRLSKLVQHTSGDAPPVESYHVDGLAQHYRTAEQALVALRANP